MPTGKLDGAGPRVPGRALTGKLGGAPAADEGRKGGSSKASDRPRDQGPKHGTSSLKLDGPPGPPDRPPTPDDFFRAHAEALAGKSSATRQKIRRLLEGLAGEGPGDKADKVYKDLGVLVERFGGGEDGLGDLMGTLASRLDEPVSPELQGSLTGDQALAEIIRALAKPESIIQGKGTATCAAAVVQIMLARKDPGKYAKVMTDLLFEGSARAPDGGRIALSTAELASREIGKETGRGAVNAAIQGSLMEFARRLAPDDSSTFDGGRYRNATTYGGGRYRTAATYGADTPSAAVGLTAEQVQALTDHMLSGSAYNLAVTEANRGDALAALQQELVGRNPGGKAINRKKGATLQAYSQDVRSGNLAGVAVGVQTESGSLHEILVLGMTATDVVFQDPGDGQTKQVSRSQFEADLRSLVLSSRNALR